MTTFQAFVFGVVNGFSEFLPISSRAHEILIPYLFGWSEPDAIMQGSISLGALLALLIYFRHDWASIISSFIQVIIFRKKPMTLDERLPIFIFLASAPVGLTWYYFRGVGPAQLEWTPLMTAATLAFFGLPIWIFDSLNRKIKGMFDWNWLDSLIIGIAQVGMIIPGCGLHGGSLSGALARNYKREVAVKFILLASAPILAASAFTNLHGVSFHSVTPSADVSWLTMGVAVVVTLFTGLLAIGGLIKHVSRKGFGQYVIYRWCLAAAVLVVYWIRNRR